MSAQLQFELVSPEATLFKKPVELVTMPGEKGYFGVLVGHTPMIVSLAPGVVDIYENDSVNITERIFVAGGFVEVTGARCTLLAEEAVMVKELDHTKLEEEVNDLIDDLDAAGSDAEKCAQIEAKLAVAKAKLEASKQ